MKNARALTPEFVALLVVAFLTRIAVYLLVPNVHWPDEIYQAMEPAHRLVYGSGAVSWEWALGIRSWLLPGALAAMMEVGRAFGAAPALVHFPVALFMAVLGCVPALCGYLWARRRYDRAGAFAAAIVPAFWVDLVYMATHTLTEVVAAATLVVALYLGYPGAGAPPSRRRLFAAGMLLGLTFALRFHLAPALLVAVIGLCGLRASLARWRAVLAGTLSVVVLAAAALDWVTLGTPLQSVWLNLWVNLGLGVSDEAGRSPLTTLLFMPLYLWGGGFAVVLLAALVGVRRLPLLGLVALAVIVTHTLIPHQEYRFIYPALTLLAILAGIGTGELLAMLREARPHAFSAPRIPAMLAAIFWITTAFAIALSPVYLLPWSRERAQLQAFDYVSRQPDPCGVGLYGLRWTVTPGQSGLPPDVTLHQTDSAHLAHDADGFNYIVARQKAPVPDSRYREAACFAGDRGAEGRAYVHVCVWHRDGACVADAAPPLPVNWPRTLTGEKEQPDPPPGFKDQDDD